MTEVFEELQLSVGSLRQDRRAEGLHDLLDSDILVRELVSSGADETESTHTNGLEIRVP
jgi:hypothetical protein